MKIKNAVKKYFTAIAREYGRILEKNGTMIAI